MSKSFTTTNVSYKNVVYDPKMKICVCTHTPTVTMYVMYMRRVNIRAQM